MESERRTFIPDIALSVNTTLIFDTSTGLLSNNTDPDARNLSAYSIGIVHRELSSGFNVQLTQDEMISNDWRIVRSIIPKIAPLHYLATSYHLSRVKAPDPYVAGSGTSIEQGRMGCQSHQDRHITSLVSRDTWNSSCPQNRLYEDCYAPVRSRRTGISRSTNLQDNTTTIHMYWVESTTIPEGVEIDPREEIPLYRTRARTTPFLQISSDDIKTEESKEFIERMDTCSQWVMSQSGDESSGVGYLKVPTE
ncbi:hypothetical protein V865_008356 [Kwoniella europaea PYCC6329]|uniref:Uncharacterized protein n=1 Tax=Kwoniella europaea PYCC6329 TaxID=1423913 RepID=A0AAX4KWQ6_9TREE